MLNFYTKAISAKKDETFMVSGAIFKIIKKWTKRRKCAHTGRSKKQTLCVWKLNAGSATRCDREKAAQNVAQSISCEN
jgi:hypothetical protein